jgi:hypothetical protein
VDEQRVKNQYAAFVLATGDMREAFESAHYLARAQSAMGGAEFALTTGVVVSYARPFVKSRTPGYPRLDEKRWAPDDADARTLHYELLRLRDVLYAHNDETEMRRAMDAGSHRWEAGVGMIGEWTAPVYPLEFWKAVSDLAARQRNLFLNKAIELGKMLTREDAESTNGV